jgi:hypothetical protein
VHILDYKPDATTNKPIAQLAIYALVLTRLIPGLRLFDIKCAGLNEKSYARPKNRRRPSRTFHTKCTEQRSCAIPDPQEVEMVGYDTRVSAAPGAI